MTRLSALRRLYFAVICLLVPVAVHAQAPPEMGWLGISIAEVNEELAERLGSVFGPAEGTGVQVVDVLKGGPAEAAGLQRGDVIVRVDAQPIWDVRQLQRTVRAQPISRRVVLSVLREKSRVSVPVTVGPMPIAAKAQLAGERLGFVVRAVEDAAGSSPAPVRIVIAFVDPDSPASRAGLQPQDTIVRVNDQPVRDLEGFAQALWRSQKSAALVVERRGAPAPISATLEFPR
ncbi:MAG: htrA [candidate division NC10 bacterium]|nr:htrA [candidate division NC10 bacterium]